MPTPRLFSLICIFCLALVAPSALAAAQPASISAEKLSALCNEGTDAEVLQFLGQWPAVMQNPQKSHPGGESFISCLFERRGEGIISALQQGGADINMADSEGDTPLYTPSRVKRMWPRYRGC